MQSKVGMGQDKTMQGGDEDPIAIPDGEYYSCFQPHGHWDVDLTVADLGDYITKTMIGDFTFF